MMINAGSGERSVVGRTKQRQTRRRNWGDIAIFSLLLLPLLIVVLGLTLYPIYSALVLSVHSSTTFASANTPFIGLQNFRRFFSDPLASQVIQNSYLRGVGGVIPSYIVGLLIALALNQRVRAAGFFRVLGLVPYVLSAPVVAQIWILILNPLYGVLPALGVHNPPDLLGNPSSVWSTLLFINTWTSFQIYTIVLLAALQRIPPEQYEAARVDGASAWARFRYVTLPAIVPTSLVIMTLHFIWSFQDFNLVWTLTGGGPINSTQTLATYAYQNGFQNFEMGYATATTLIMAVLMLLTLGVLALVYLAARWAVGRWQTRREERQAQAFAVAAAGSLSTTSPGVTRAQRPAIISPRLRAPRWVRVARPYVWIFLALCYALLPILFLLSVSLRGAPPSGQQYEVSLFPAHPALSNYSTVLTSSVLWTPPPFAINFLNSVIVSGSITLLCIIIAALGAYTLSHWRNPFTRSITGGMLLAQAIPLIVLVFPLYELMVQIHLINTRPGLIFATLPFVLPFSVLLFKVFYESLPAELEQAAAIDGCGHLRALIHIVLPLSLPAIGAVAAFTFLSAWNEFLLALTMINSDALRTLPPRIQIYASTNGFAGQFTEAQQAVFILLPVAAAIIILIAVQRYLTSGYQAGGVKE